MWDSIFAFLHLGGLLAVAGYAIYSLVSGNVTRFALIAVLLALYYHFVLHKAVLKEVARRRSLKSGK
jgi:heme exporter protein D